jgi:hypothetical protein
MTARSSFSATVIAGAAVMLLTTAVLADTCCANLPVGLDPSSAMPGDVIRLVGLQCLNADNSGPNALKLGVFWLAKGKRAAEALPDTAPGPGLPELPPIEEWRPFTTVPDATETIGDATIVVPDLPAGTYQLWWWCDDGSGPGGGIHYSTGPRLVIGGSPQTDTAALNTTGTSGSSGWPVGLVLALGAAAFVGTIRSGPFRSSRGHISRAGGGQSGSA